MGKQRQLMVGPSGVRLEGALDVYSVGALKQPLLNELFCRPAVNLDLSDVSEMDGAGMQLLLLLKREADAVGRPLRLCGSNPLVDEILELCELSHLFASLS